LDALAASWKHMATPSSASGGGCGASFAKSFFGQRGPSVHRSPLQLI
jgi:hypothetical protein